MGGTGLSHDIFLKFSLKGQSISKANSLVVNSSKKRTNEFVFTTMRSVFVHFLEEIEDTKKHFEITRPLCSCCDEDENKIQAASILKL